MAWVFTVALEVAGFSLREGPRLVQPRFPLACHPPSPPPSSSWRLRHGRVLILPTTWACEKQEGTAVPRQAHGTGAAMLAAARLRPWSAASVCHALAASPLRPMWPSPLTTTSQACNCLARAGGPCQTLALAGRIHAATRMRTCAKRWYERLAGLPLAQARPDLGEEGGGEASCDPLLELLRPQHVQLLAAGREGGDA